MILRVKWLLRQMRSGYLQAEKTDLLAYCAFLRGN
jgi:hypothetical protein